MCEVKGKQNKYTGYRILLKKNILQKKNNNRTYFSREDKLKAKLLD